MPATKWTPERIKQLREKLKLTQVQFAARLGVYQPRIAEYEAGTRIIRPTMQRLLDMVERDRSA